MSKYIICNYGDAEIGKSSTLRDVISFLELSKNAVREGDIEWLYDGATKSKTDWYAKYIINGVKVAICTQGDPDSIQPEKLKASAAWGADVIVCAARDDTGKAREDLGGGDTVLNHVSPTTAKIKNALDNIKKDIETVDNVYVSGGVRFDDYIKIWYRNFFVSHGDDNFSSVDVNTLKEMSRVSAKGIIEMIESLFRISII